MRTFAAGKNVQLRERILICTQPCSPFSRNGEGWVVDSGSVEKPLHGVVKELVFAFDELKRRNSELASVAAMACGEVHARPQALVQETAALARKSQGPTA